MAAGSLIEYSINYTDGRNYHLSIKEMKLLVVITNFTSYDNNFTGGTDSVIHVWRIKKGNYESSGKLMSEPGSAGLRFATMLHVLERHARESGSISLSLREAQ